MTDIAPALRDALAAPLVDLSPFEGLPVRRSAIEIPGAAGGLRDAMKIDPQEFHKGERVFVVLECEVAKIRFDPIDKAEPAGDQARVHVFNVEAATIVDESLVKQQLDEQRERIEAAKRHASGAVNLDDHVDQLVAEHEAGEHAPDLVDGCPTCEEEKDLAARGQ